MSYFSHANILLSLSKKVINNNKVWCGDQRDMKGVKGKIIRKLKNIQSIGSLRVQGLVFQVNNNNPSFDTNIINNKHTLKDLNNVISFDDHDHDHDREDIIIADLLSEFEEKCPPGGSDKVILYTTSLRGIRKTYEDCRAVRSLLESHKVSFSERDVSLDQGFREELWGVLGGKIVPPRLFVKGRYVGGAEEVVGVLNEQGKLGKLFEGVPVLPPGSRCLGCANVRFLVCSNCSGSRKVLEEDSEGGSSFSRCPECNENGLVKCSFCC